MLSRLGLLSPGGKQQDRAGAPGGRGTPRALLQQQHPLIVCVWLVYLGKTPHKCKDVEGAQQGEGALRYWEAIHQDL